MLTALLIALIIGAIAGWLAGLLVQGTGFGLLGDILVGIVGALMTSVLLPGLGIGLTLGAGLTARQGESKGCGPEFRAPGLDVVTAREINQGV